MSLIYHRFYDVRKITFFCYLFLRLDMVFKLVHRISIFICGGEILIISSGHSNGMFAILTFRLSSSLPLFGLALLLWFWVWKEIVDVLNWVLFISVFIWLWGREIFDLQSLRFDQHIFGCSDLWAYLDLLLGEADVGGSVPLVDALRSWF